MGWFRTLGQTLTLPHSPICAAVIPLSKFQRTDQTATFRDYLILSDGDETSVKLSEHQRSTANHPSKLYRENNRVSMIQMLPQIYTDHLIPPLACNLRLDLIQNPSYIRASACRYELPVTLICAYPQTPQGHLDSTSLPLRRAQEVACGI
jgi:hypothetical protein